MGISTYVKAEALRRTTVTVAFDGGAGTGASAGGGNVPLFTVTGEVLVVALVPFCTESLASAGGGTLALSVTGASALFIAATTATNIDANMFWVDTGPDANGVALPAALKDIVITDNIVGTVATADITDGTIRFDVYYLPLSGDGLIS